MLNKRFYIGFFFLSFISLLCACDTTESVEDPSKNYFFKYYGRDGDQEGIDVVVGADGSIYLLGNSVTSTSATGKQLYVVKTDAEGKLIYEKTFSGKTNYEAKDIELTTDGRLIIVTNFEAAINDTDIFILTMDQNLVPLDSTVFGYIGYNEDASSVTQISNGFIVAGSTTNTYIKPSGNSSGIDQKDALFARFLDDLTVVSDQFWKTTAGPGTIDVAVKILPIPSAVSNSTKYYVFGYSNRLVGTLTDINYWYFGLSDTGENPSGDGTAGLPTDDEMLASATISPSKSGAGFMLVGNSIKPNGEYDIYVTKLRNELKYNVNDIYYSQGLLAGLGPLEFNRVSVYSSINTGYLILANTKSTTSNSFYLTKLNNEGIPAWSDPESLIFGGQKDDYIGAVSELPDGKIILIGTMSLGDEAQKKMTLIKVNKDGKFLD